MSIQSRVTEIYWSPSTLIWDGDDLLNVAGGDRATIRGEKTSLHYFLTYRFNAALGLNHGGNDWWVVYEVRGTKALLLRNGEVERELNRSYYCADAYSYPIALAVAPNDRVVLLHCPTKFNLLEIEDVETGERLASAETRFMEFHSRLTVSCDNRYVIDAGWFWHPVSGVWVFDLREALRLVDFKNLSSLTDEQVLNNYDIDGACFVDSEHVALSSSADSVGCGNNNAMALDQKQLGVWSLNERRWISKIALDEVTGPMMAWRNYVVSFYGHPKLIDLSTGKVVQRWTEIDSGKETGAASLEDPKTPVRALDPEHGRFAVANKGKVHVVELFDVE